MKSVSTVLQQGKWLPGYGGFGSVIADEVDVFSAPGQEVAKRLSVLRQDQHTAARITVTS